MTRLIIPAYNEGANLGSLAESIAASLRDEPYQLYVVNDGSRDGTATVATALQRHHPLTLLTHAVNRGVAAAFRTGLQAAVIRDAADEDIVVLMEGDGTSDPALLPEMIRRARAGADVVIASRYQPGGGYRRFPLKRLLLSRGANLVLRLVFPIPGVRDYTIFYRAYRVPPLRSCMAAFGPRFIEATTFLANAEVLVKLRPYLRRVEEVPLVYDYGRKRGKSGMKIGNNLRSYLAFLLRHATKPQAARVAKETAVPAPRPGGT